MIYFINIGHTDQNKKTELTFKKKKKKKKKCRASCDCFYHFGLLLKSWT